jgi:hypothetical protein
VRFTKFGAGRMGVSFLNRNFNFPVARETPPKPSGCPCKAQKDLYAGKNPFWGCPETNVGNGCR